MSRKSSKPKPSLSITIRPRGVNAFLWGAGTVLDVFGAGVPKVRLGSLKNDILKVGEDFAVVGRIIRAETTRQLLGTAQLHGVDLNGSYPKLRAKKPTSKAKVLARTGLVARKVAEPKLNTKQTGHLKVRRESQTVTDR